MKNIDVNQIIKPTEADKSIPYVITPRNTFLDTLKPTIRWNEVLGATSYLIKIVTDSKVVWTTQAKGTEFKSSDDLPLEPGVTYSLIIESDNGHSSEMDPNPSLLEFKILDDQEILDVSYEIAKEKELRHEDETLRIVDIYREHELNAKAIEILEGKINNSIQPAGIYLELGNFYQCIDLYLSAQKQYQTSLDLIKGKHGLEVGMAAIVELAATAELIETLTLLGNQDEAVKLKTELEFLKAKTLTTRAVCPCCVKDGICGTKFSGKCMASILCTG